MGNEIWRSTEFDGYSVSNIGRVRFDKTNNILKETINDRGYKRVCIYKHGTPKVHRLVANAFCERGDGRNEVNHKDGNKLNNKAENLEWCNRQENMAHASKTGLRKMVNVKITEEQVSYIRSHYAPRDKENGCRALARKFSLSHTTVRRILADKTIAYKK